MTTATATNLTDYRAAGGEAYSSKNQRILAKLVEREIVHCVSYLVDHFAKHGETALAGSDYSIDDILQICERRADHSDRIEEIEGEISELEESESEAIEKGSEAEEKEARRKIASLEKEKEQLEYEQENPDEVLEHWAVTKWLAGKLAEFGESTGELFDLQIWGRTCSGQGIALDCVIAEIAASMEILDGQRNSWAD